MSIVFSFYLKRRWEDWYVNKAAPCTVINVLSSMVDRPVGMLGYLSLSHESQPLASQKLLKYVLDHERIGLHGSLIAKDIGISLATNYVLV